MQLTSKSIMWGIHPLSGGNSILMPELLHHPHTSIFFFIPFYSYLISLQKYPKVLEYRNKNQFIFLAPQMIVLNL